MHWRTALTELLEAGSCRTQGELVIKVQKMTGELVNQATVSRELQALGAVKVDGAYRSAPPVSLGAPVHKFSVTSNGCMAVVRTDSAYANVIGHAVDAAELDGVLGTIAGDDTVFVALQDASAVPGLRRLLGLGERRTTVAA